MSKEEDKTKSETASSSGIQATKVPVNNRPSVAYLLAHGDPATEHLPKTWKEIYGFPLVVSFIFFLSLLTFHYAPHSTSTRHGFQLPQRNKPIFNPVTVTKEPEPVAPEIFPETDQGQDDPVLMEGSAPEEEILETKENDVVQEVEETEKEPTEGQAEPEAEL